MTLTATAPPRANSKGDRCPPWCVTDHGQEPIPGCAETTHSSEAVHSAARISVGAVLFAGDVDAEIQVCAPQVDGGSLFLEAREARYLAIMIEQLADATPEQHRELAAAIRQAAAAITEADRG